MIISENDLAFADAFDEFVNDQKAEKVNDVAIYDKVHGKLTDREIEIALEAINKWLYFGWNFEHVHYKWKCGDETREAYVPDFLAGARWVCSFDHIYEKWLRSCNHPDAFLVTFYANLDVMNRIALLEWVMENYKDERPLF